jgi:hypothetical protein
MGGKMSFVEYYRLRLLTLLSAARLIIENRRYRKHHPIKMVPVSGKPFHRGPYPTGNLPHDYDRDYITHPDD